MVAATYAEEGLVVRTRLRGRFDLERSVKRQRGPSIYASLTSLRKGADGADVVKALGGAQGRAAEALAEDALCSSTSSSTRR